MTTLGPRSLTSAAVPENQDSDQSASEPLACMPCRGTGKVISRLGGEPSEVPCPWCGGTGVKPEGEVDAQSHAPRVEPSEEAGEPAGANAGEG